MLDKDILENVAKEENNNPNEILEIEENEEITKTQYDLKDIEDSKEKKKKVKKPNKWTLLPKKTKIIIIVSIVLVLLVGIGLIIYFFVLKEKDPNDKRPENPVVIVEKDNYRYEDGFLVIIDEDKKELVTSLA